MVQMTIKERWFRCLAPTMRPTIIWTNVDQDIWRHMSTQGHYELMISFSNSTSTNQSYQYMPLSPNHPWVPKLLSHASSDTVQCTDDPQIEGILPKGPYLPCVSMAGRALLAGYPPCPRNPLSIGRRSGVTGILRNLYSKCVFVLDTAALYATTSTQHTVVMVLTLSSLYWWHRWLS